MNKYPLSTRIIHWISALIIVSLFVSGWFMVDLDYYSSWYQTLPDLHQIFGLALLFLWLYKILRLFWIKQPKTLETLKPYEKFTATVVKLFFYVLVLVLCSTGYFMSTAGDQHALLGWLTLPSLWLFESEALDMLGNTHRYMAYTIIVLMLLHLLAALKHHFYNKDATLRRMI
ncbi:cytochrome b [Marinicella rhabdoformis]|uniref:cytochrome b n=1 Tax=Marinicella rhabdoformis TaxID=2580566 RepID=UPI0012AED554|nr:cytochrome b/b6 domain-containing protein [Marinicella rhabdoformis]